MDGTGLLFGPIVAAIAPEVESIVVTYPDEPLSYAQLELIARAALLARLAAADPDLLMATPTRVVDVWRGRGNGGQAS